MNNYNLEDLSLKLINYFINYHNYKIFNIPKKMQINTKNEFYLINKNNDNYHIIKIIKNKNFNNEQLNNKDKIYKMLYEKLESKGIKKINYLIIFLNNDNKNENRILPKANIIIATSDKILQELSVFFPNINQIITSKLSNNKIIYKLKNKIKKNYNNKINMIKQKINFQNRNYINEVLKKCNNDHLVITLFIFIIPIIALIISSIIINTTQDNWLALNYNKQHLIFGASYHNLIFSSHQYWRWIIYPFAGNDINNSAPINLIFSLWIFYRVGRFIEGFYGWWKSIIIWFGAIILTGILQSNIDNINIMSGFWVFPIISLGAMLPFIWNYKLFKSSIMHTYFKSFFLMLIFWFITDQQIFTLLYWIIGFVNGLLFASLIGNYNQKLNIYYVFSLIAVIILLIFSASLWYFNNNYHIDENNYTLEVLKKYQKIGLINQNQINKIMFEYFHIKL